MIRWPHSAARHDGSSSWRARDGGSGVSVETKTAERARVKEWATPLGSLLSQRWNGLRRAAATTAGRLFAFFACLYILTYKGSLTTLDGMLMYQTTKSLVDRGS